MKEEIKFLKLNQDAVDQIVYDYSIGENIILELQNELIRKGDNLISYDLIWIEPDVQVSILGEIALQALISDFVNMKNLAVIKKEYRNSFLIDTF